MSYIFLSPSILLDLVIEVFLFFPEVPQKARVVLRGDFFNFTNKWFDIFYVLLEHKIDFVILPLWIVFVLAYLLKMLDFVLEQSRSHLYLDR
jgi:hypothetical protein